MKIGFYSPYLSTLAGGERYLFTLASHWSKKHDVSVFWDDPKILSQAATRLNLDLSRVYTVENVFGTRNIFKKMLVSRGYDVIFFLTDGSIPTTFARHNILHFQVPFHHLPVHQIKLARYDAIVCNSDFTKRHLDERLARQAIVIYPPVAPIKKQKVHKERLIISIGRFHPFKKQDILISAFRRISGYRLVLAGGLLPADKAYFETLQKAAKGLAIKFMPNITHAALNELYNNASIYWHAAGYREVKPEKMEHFGITTVEAMSAGAVPVVYNGGGQSEIVHDGRDGYLWTTVDELVQKTHIAETAHFSTAMKARVNEFSDRAFTTAYDTLLSSIIA